MATIALVSAGNAPGVTTTAFALTLAWPGPTLLAECSPAGGHLLAGYFRGSLSAADRGLWQLALQTRHGVGAAMADLGNQLITLDDSGAKKLLPGLRDPFKALQISEDMWMRIGELLAHLPVTTLIDIGHAGADLPPLVRTADLVMMTLRPEPAQIAAARPRLEVLRDALGDTAQIGLCVLRDGDYSVREVEHALSRPAGGFAVSAHLPDDPKSAAVLTRGTKPGRGFTTAPLLREAALLARNLYRGLEQTGTPAPVPFAAPHNSSPQQSQHLAQPAQHPGAAHQPRPAPPTAPPLSERGAPNGVGYSHPGGLVLRGGDA